MTKREFEKMAQRILIAFDLPTDLPFASKRFRKESSDVQYFLMCEIAGLEIKVWIYETAEIWGFQIYKDIDNRLLCSEWDHTPIVAMGSHQYEYVSILARAMFCLGLDISPLEIQFNLAISAHEKLEWQLEFQRRMRDETSQVE